MEHGIQPPVKWIDAAPIRSTLSLIRIFEWSYIRVLNIFDLVIAKSTPRDLPYLLHGYSKAVESRSSRKSETQFRDASSRREEYFEILQSAIDQCAKFSNTGALSDIAARYGALPSKNVWGILIRNNRLGVIEWMLERGLSPPNRWLTDCRELEILQLLARYGLKMDVLDIVHGLSRWLKVSQRSDKQLGTDLWYWVIENLPEIKKSIDYEDSLYRLTQNLIAKPDEYPG